MCIYLIVEREKKKLFTNLYCTIVYTATRQLMIGTETEKNVTIFHSCRSNESLMEENSNEMD